MNIYEGDIDNLTSSLMNALNPNLVIELGEVLKKIVDSLNYLENQTISQDSRLSVNEVTTLQNQNDLFSNLMRFKIMNSYDEDLVNFLNEINDIMSALQVLNYVNDFPKLQRNLESGKCSELLRRLYLEIELKANKEGE